MTTADAKKVAAHVVDMLRAQGFLAAPTPAPHGSAGPRWLAPHEAERLRPFAPLVPHLLTLVQFACCVAKCEEVVRRRIRDATIPRHLVSGPPYFIAREALEVFNVPMSAAAERLFGSPIPPPTRAQSSPRSRV